MEFETGFTSEFIRRSLPHGARRILEVGCGAGELADALSQDELVVVAIDRDPESVGAARKRGIDARVAIWPEFTDGEFDAVLFTRSLHHIHPLKKAVEHAADSLTQKGRLIIEDFAYEQVDEKTLCWFEEEIDALDAKNVLVKDNEFWNSVRSKTEGLVAWRSSHESDLYPAGAILKEVQRVFGPMRSEEVPYFFRYLVKAIAPGVNRNQILRNFAEREAALISRGIIVPLGRRIVAGRG